MPLTDISNICTFLSVCKRRGKLTAPFTFKNKRTYYITNSVPAAQRTQSPHEKNKTADKQTAIIETTSAAVAIPVFSFFLLTQARTSPTIEIGKDTILKKPPKKLNAIPAIPKTNAAIAITSDLLNHDNYIVYTLKSSDLKILTKKNKNVEVVLLTSDKSNLQKIDVQKFNKEYPKLKVVKTNKFHDRFIIIDDKEMYHLGSSIKDLGKKCFAINKIEDMEIISKFVCFNLDTNYISI